ncbi:hypothetical protein TX25_29870 [Pseudomonas lactis]|uniref:hypothetical protein n=1 Tax=Pseudomonas lactis TaxID=1615674 RepID=UPI0007125744|nr:hypothetical protein [Pseudomonas lactis]KRP80615.1 hypothetical protein TX25_29870 [Pseudomonas lactis]
MNLDELNAARIELAQQIAASLEKQMADFKQKTGVAVSDLEIETNTQQYMDGSRSCVILSIDIQLDVQIKLANGIGASTHIRFEN